MKFKFAKLIVALLAVCFVFGGMGAITARADENEKVYLGGFTLGFDLEGEGALVVGLAEVVGCESIYMPARDAGIKSGDVILSLDGKKIKIAADVDEVLSKYKGGGIVAEISDGKNKRIVNVYPQTDVGGKYKMGVLIRDYMTGLGTVTFIREGGEFYSLGHPITDERGEFLKIGGGICYPCTVNGVVKGERGRAGELKGSLNRTQILGKVEQNSLSGLVGRFEIPSFYGERPQMPLGEPEMGAAKIYACINGNSVQSYSISIVKVDKNERANKNMVVKITDERLIDEAGGIVQGMSGSPVVQNGKIVGAITHVFLNDATRGYAISVKNML